MRIIMVPNCDIMTHLLLFALVFGSLHIPAYQASSDSNNPDSLEYSEDEDPPDSLVATANSPAALLPYFDQENITVYYQLNVTSVKLDCPVKNYEASHHAILWYKGDALIVNGDKPISNIHSVDNKFALTIAPVNNRTADEYSCRVMPANVRHRINLKLGIAPILPPSPPSPTTTITTKTTTNTTSSTMGFHESVCRCLWPPLLLTVIMAAHF